MEMNDCRQHQQVNGESRSSNNHSKARKRLISFFIFKNDCQRKNFILTCCIYVNVLLLGWTYGQLGTVFADLQLILGTNVEQTSFLFTVNSIGYMAGSLTIGFIFDRVEPLKLLGMVSIVNGVTSAVSPWCSIYGLFLSVRLLDGFLAGGRDSGGNAKIMACWGNEGRSFLLALHFCYSIGGIISPLITRFFLAPKLHHEELNTTSSALQIWNVSMNFSHVDRFNNVSLRSNIPQDDIITYGETKIHMAFLITGILTGVSGIAYLLLGFNGFDKVPTYTRPAESKQDSSKFSKKAKRVRLDKYQIAVFIILLGMAVTLSTALECKSFSFIMPFVLLQLKWSKDDGAFLISVLWAFYSIGRVSGVFISRFRFFQPHRIIIVSMLVIIISSSGLYIGSVYHVIALIWIMVPLMGVGISCCFPTFIVWTHENVLKISGKVGGFFQFVGSLGCFLDPLYIGALMENVSPLYFVYVQIFQSALSLFLFVVIITRIARLRRRSCNIT